MMVGSYPKPRWFNTGLPLPVGNYPPDSLITEALEDCITVIVQDQLDAGLDVITDGLVQATDASYTAKLYYIADRLTNVVPQGPQIPLPTYSTAFSPTVLGPVARKAPMMVKHVQTLRRLTDRPIKVNFPGPQVFALGLNNTHYPSPVELGMDLAAAFNEEFKDLAAAGVDIIQLDEFLWHYALSDAEWEVEMFNKMVDGVDAQIVVHVCWGNYAGTTGYLPASPEAAAAQMDRGSFRLSRRERGATTSRAEAIFPRSQKVNIWALNYEIAHQGVGDLEPLRKNNWDKPFIAGVVDVKSTEIETAEEVADRIRAALEIIPAEDLGLTTDCGMINLPRIICQQKLQALVDGANLVRGELS
jgi:5-methyltetrahydropteroyltriglutamate--homocysteine methyltransferase